MVITWYFQWTAIMCPKATLHVSSIKRNKTIDTKNSFTRNSVAQEAPDKRRITKINLVSSTSSKKMKRAIDQSKSITFPRCMPLNFKFRWNQSGLFFLLLPPSWIIPPRNSSRVAEKKLVRHTFTWHFSINSSLFNLRLGNGILSLSIIGLPHAINPRFSGFSFWAKILRMLNEIAAQVEGRAS